jgi:DNA polymerase III sliding clamp (beta) subunit (PCNA family)
MTPPVKATKPTETTLTFDAKSALRAIRAVAPMRSLDDCRPTLTDIHISVERNVATFVTTDSYRLAIVDITAGRQKAGWIDIPGSMVARLLKLMSTLRPEEEDPLTVTQLVDGRARTVTLRVDGAVLSATVEREHPFPGYDALIPAPDAEVVAEAVAFNPSYLAPLKALLKETNGDKWDGDSPVVVSTYGSKKPALFTIHKPAHVLSARMVLMPVRIS